MVLLSGTIENALPLTYDVLCFVLSNKQTNKKKKKNKDFPSEEGRAYIRIFNRPQTKYSNGHAITDKITRVSQSFYCSHLNLVEDNSEGRIAVSQMDGHNFDNYSLVECLKGNTSPFLLIEMCYI